MQSPATTRTHAAIGLGSTLLVAFALVTSAFAEPLDSRAAPQDDDAVAISVDDPLGIAALLADLPSPAVELLQPWLDFGAPPPIEADAQTLLVRSRKSVPGAVPRRASTSNVPRLALADLDVASLLADDLASKDGAKLLRIGVERMIPEADDAGSWTLVDGRWTWSLAIESPGAEAVRVLFTELDLPTGAMVRTLGESEGDDASPFTLRSGASGDAWTPHVRGERIVVALTLPESARGPLDALPFRIGSIMHVYRKLDGEDPIDLAVPCHERVACHPAWANVARSVGRVSFVSGSAEYLCSGQLVNAQNSDFTPYFITAAHCIATNAEARSAVIHWLYQSSSCGSAPPSLGSTPASSACTLLATSASADTSLLMVEGVLPDVSLTWCGWTTASVPAGTDVVSIHHPGGAHKRISLGERISGTLCTPASGHFKVDWDLGLTEGGSSGGGAFRASDRRLVGVLHCGYPAVCNGTNIDGFGAFASAYPTLASYLQGGSDDELEGPDTCSGARTIGAGLHRRLIVKDGDDDWYRVQVPPHKKLRVTAYFKDAWGDIDLAAYRGCSDKVDQSTTTDDRERVEWTNASNSAKWVRIHVYLYDDVRNGYKLRVQFKNP